MSDDEGEEEVRLSDDDDDGGDGVVAGTRTIIPRQSKKTKKTYVNAYEEEDVEDVDMKDEEYEELVQTPTLTAHTTKDRSVDSLHGLTGGHAGAELSDFGTYTRNARNDEHTHDAIASLDGIALGDRRLSLLGAADASRKMTSALSEAGSEIQSPVGLGRKARLSAKFKAERTGRRMVSMEAGEEEGGATNADAYTDPFL